MAAPASPSMKSRAGVAEGDIRHPAEGQDFGPTVFAVRPLLTDREADRRLLPLLGKLLGVSPEYSERLEIARGLH